MARPKEPLIDRHSIVDAALKILELDGLDGLSLRRLGKELNVNPASIYHYFDGKESILRAAIRKILREIEVPPDRYEWKRWMVQSAVNYWQLLFQKPYIAPIMLSGIRPVTEVGLRNGEMMTAAGIPIGRQRDITQAFEACVLGWALMATSREEELHPPATRPEELLRLQLSLLLDHFAAGGTDEAPSRTPRARKTQPE